MLDMEKASHRVCHLGLVYKHSISIAPRRVNTVATFQEDRLFQVTVKNAVSIARSSAQVCHRSYITRMLRIPHKNYPRQRGRDAHAVWQRCRVYHPIDQPRAHIARPRSALTPSLGWVKASCECCEDTGYRHCHETAAATGLTLLGQTVVWPPPHHRPAHYTVHYKLPININ